MIAPANSPHSIRPVEDLLNLGCEVVFMAERDPFCRPRAGYCFQKMPVWRGKRWLRRISDRVSCLCDCWLERRPLQRVKERLKIDVVHASWVNENAALCAEAGLRPLIFTVWGSDINCLFDPAVDKAYRARIGRALAQADLILVDSSDMIDKCAQLAGRPLNVKMQMVGIDTQLFRPGLEEEGESWRKRFNIQKACRVFFSPRGLLPHYGQRAIIDGYAQALPRFDGETVLVINRFGVQVGSPPSGYELDLRQQVAVLGIQDHIRWMDPVPVSQLPGAYAGCDVVVNFPSRDAFPVTFLEAAACEKPVITRALPAYEGTLAAKFFTMIRDGQVGELAEAMVASVQGKPSAATNELLKAARQHVVTNYDNSITSAQLLNQYHNVLAVPT